MDWIPIEKYDAMKKKPKWAIFWFEATQSGRIFLRPMIRPDRVAGSRVCTHFAIITPPEGD